MTRNDEILNCVFWMIKRAKDLIHKEPVLNRCWINFKVWNCIKNRKFLLFLSYLSFEEVFLSPYFPPPFCFNHNNLWAIFFKQCLNYWKLLYTIFSCDNYYLMVYNWIKICCPYPKCWLPAYYTSCFFIVWIINSFSQNENP